MKRISRITAIILSAILLFSFTAAAHFSQENKCESVTKTTTELTIYK